MKRKDKMIAIRVTNADIKRIEEIAAFYKMTKTDAMLFAIARMQQHVEKIKIAQSFNESSDK